MPNIDADRSRTKREDLGRVTAALIGEPDRDPDSIVDEYFDNMAFQKEIPQLPEMKLFRLCVVPGARAFVGGSGVVIQCANADARDIPYALKILRPSLVGNSLTRARTEITKAEQEFAYHAPLNHPNIARVFAIGKVHIVPKANAVAIPVTTLLMEWIDDAAPFVDHLVSRCSTYTEVLKNLTECFTSLAYLHDKGLIHWDVKSPNLLVGGDGVTKLMDIGNARRRAGPPQVNIAFSTRHNYPPALESKAQDRPARGAAESANRIPIKLPKKHTWDVPWLDLWMLARELNRVFYADPAMATQDASVVDYLPKDWEVVRNQFLTRVFPPYDESAQQILAGIKLVLLRTLSPKDSTFYDTGEQASRDLGRLLPELGGAHGVPELQAIPQHVIRLPVSGNVPWTKRVAALFNTSAVQRLTRHSQLGTVPQVYPGAHHRRAEHALGVFHQTLSYVHALYADRSNVFWRISVSRGDVEALLFAAIVHDMGHIAYGHFLEEMQGLFNGRTHVDYVLAVLDPGRFAQKGTSAWQNQVESDRVELLSVVQRYWLPKLTDQAETFLARVADILRPSTADTAVISPKSTVTRAPSQQLVTEILHSILDSAIDADKMDYLLRDSHHAGVQYTQGIDRDRFFQSLTTVEYLPPSVANRVIADDRAKSVRRRPLRASIAVKSKGTLPLESLLIARYQMFSSVYWQHTVRAQTAMLQFVVQEYLGFSEPEIHDRLDELILVFGERNDRSALMWLLERVQALACDDFLRHKLVSCMEGLLGSREALFVCGHELAFDLSEPEWLNKLYSRITGISDTLNATPNPTAYFSWQRGMRMQLTERLASATNGLVTYGDVLLDLPEPHKDQVENVFVVAAGADGPTPRHIQDISPVAQAVSRTFKTRARSVRVFVNRDLMQRVTSLGLQQVFANGSLATLRAIERVHSLQRWLPLDG
jgi:uncharacterized protein